MKTIHSDRKQVSGCLGVGEGRERREKGITERPKETSWWWFHGHTPMLQGIRWWLQYGQFIVCQLFLNKAVTNTHSYTENQMPDDMCPRLLFIRNKSNKFNATKVSRKKGFVKLCSSSSEDRNRYLYAWLWCNLHDWLLRIHTNTGRSTRLKTQYKEIQSSIYFMSLLLVLIKKGWHIYTGMYKTDN